ncbi:MAG: methylated-DNA--[protein]-cysteine S-methyltransferase, partial [Chloroflexi bacterium]|nr:methylated-DNA--[protein]-cysteine S-methyltransferase [Chloroflexota bacterium]
MNPSYIKTPDGIFTAFFSERGLARLEFPKHSKTLKKLAPVQGDAPPEAKEWQLLTQAALLEALAGRRPGKPPPLDLSMGTAFQQRVWTVLQSIPPGHTLSYAEVARAIGRPTATRAVGQACGANPIPVLVPCHRVLAARGG